MKTLTALLVLASLALAGSASAKPRKARPVMCVDYAIVVDAAAQETVAICYDRHVDGGLTLWNWKEVTLTSSQGPVTVVVGYKAL
jgi:hypothetical protein